MGPRKQLRPGQRIRKQAAFKTLAEKGTFARGEFFFVWAGLQQDLGQSVSGVGPMIGIVVSREASTRASQRNILKRRIREIFRGLQHQLKKDMACLVKMRPLKERPTFAEMEAELVKLFKRTGAWA